MLCIGLFIHVFSTTFLLAVGNVTDILNYKPTNTTVIIGNKYPSTTTHVATSIMPGSDCYRELTSPTGSITSPGFPQYYIPCQQCGWKITASQGFWIKLKVITFDLHPRTNEFCRNGYVQFGTYDKGKLHGSVVLACGTMSPRTYVLQSNLGWIHFSGGAETLINTSFQGFHIQYERFSVPSSDSAGSSNLTLLAMLLLIVPIACPVLVYVYVKKMRAKAMSEPEWKAAKRFRKKHYHRKSFRPNKSHNIQITVEQPSDEEQDNKSGDLVRPSGNYENYQVSEGDTENSQWFEDMSTVNESVFREDSPNFDGLFHRTSKSSDRDSSKYLSIPCSSTPHDLKASMLYLSLLPDSEKTSSKHRTSSRQRYSRESQSMGRLLSTASIRNIDGKPILVLNQICKSKKFGDLRELNDSTDVHKFGRFGKRRRSSTASIKIKQPNKRTKRMKSESIQSIFRPQNDRINSLKFTNEHLSRRSKSLSIRDKHESSTSSERSRMEMLQTSRLNNEKSRFLKPVQEEKSGISSNMSRSQPPAIPEPDYSSEPLRDTSQNIYFSACSQYDGQFFHEESPGNDGQLYVVPGYRGQGTSPLQRHFSDRAKGTKKSDCYFTPQNPVLPSNQLHSGMISVTQREAKDSVSELHRRIEEYSINQTVYHKLPRIHRENLNNTSQFMEGSTVLAGNLVSNSTADEGNISKCKELSIPEIHIQGASDDSMHTDNEKDKILQTQLNSAAVMEIDNPAFETSLVESPKIYDKEEVDEIYNSRASLCKSKKVDGNNNENVDLCRTVMNEFSLNDVIVLQRGESMV